VPPRSAPLVVTIHDLAFVHDPSGFTRRGLRFFRRGLALARAEADAVVCSSTATLEDCAGHGFDRSRLHLVPLGVHVVPTGPAQVAAARHRYGLGRPYLLFAGTHEPRKNLARLVEAFALLAPDRELVLAGPTGWGDQQAPAPGVRAVGFVPEADLRALYAGADAFVYPSVREGFGLPVLEAMAQGTPVVTSRRTSTEEVAGGAAVLVDPLDPADIARGITEAVDRTAELAELGRARAAACSWDRTAELTLDVYGKVTR
jgi:glycosyltransferase involved in cell wall biosynthesis